jgi:hypothetical protein
VQPLPGGSDPDAAQGAAMVAFLMHFAEVRRLLVAALRVLDGG